MGNVYDFSTMPAFGITDKAVAGFLAIYLAVVLFTFVYSIAVYILQSVGLYAIAKRRGIHKPWLAWIPVANMWVLGCISDQYQYVAKGNITNRRKILLGMIIAIFVLVLWIFMMAIILSFDAVGSGAMTNSLGKVIGTLLFLALLYLALIIVAVIAAVFQYIALYDLFASSRPNCAVVFLVLGILFNFLLPYFIFACRKKDGGMPPRRAVYGSNCV